MCIKVDNEQKITFYTNHRLFEPLVVFFGINNSFATFQTIINDIFRDLIVKEIMIVYLDNIIIFIQTLEDYYKRVCRVLEILAKYKLYLCSTRYEFNRQKIEYLALVILENQVEIDFAKIVDIYN